MARKQMIEDPEFLAKLWEWNNLQDELKSLQAKERRIRSELFEAAFRRPIVGTNTVSLPEGWTLKGVRKQNLKLDADALVASREMFEERGVPVDDLVKYTPSLSTTEYKRLDDELRGVFDAVVTISEGTSTLTLVPPKEKP